MCRMLIAFGNVNTSWLIDDLITMANDKNEKHEYNENEDFKHGDGWGISYLKNNELILDKSILPCYDDRSINSYRKLKSPIIILHARLGSQGKGGAHLTNTHPFKYSEYVFCHNGTVNEKFKFDSQFIPNGQTDSELLFYYLLSERTNGFSIDFLLDKLLNIKDYFGVNFILSDGNISYIANWYNERPDYYTLKLLENPDSLIISSEILPHYKDQHWQYLENHNIIKINTLTREYSIVSA